MKKLRLGFAVLYLVALLLSLTAFQAAAQDANFVGSWDMTVTGGGRGGGQGDGQSGRIRLAADTRRWRSAIAHHHERRRQIQSDSQNAARRKHL